MGWGIGEEANVIVTVFSNQHSPVAENSKKQGRQGKVCSPECRVPEDSRKRQEGLLQ